MIRQRFLIGFFGAATTLQTNRIFGRALSSAPPTFSWKSRPAPAFDVFEEQIVGTWYSDDETTSDNDDTSWPVEEVMRSCGGAVQGIRELPLERYLNRADDGFIFLNNGCYSAGPVLQQKSTGDDEKPILTCFSWGDSGRILCSTADKGDGPATSQALFLKRRGKLGQEISLDPFEDEKQHSLRWHTHIRCTMPSKSMPWMLQRAKWEGWVDDDALADTTITISERLSFRYTVGAKMSPEDALKQWCLPSSLWVASASEGLANNSDLFAIIVGREGTTGFIYQSMVREYDQGKLVGITWSSGQEAGRS